MASRRAWMISRTKLVTFHYDPRHRGFAIRTVFDDDQILWRVEMELDEGAAGVKRISLVANLALFPVISILPLMSFSTESYETLHLWTSSLGIMLTLCTSFVTKNRSVFVFVFV